VCHFSTDDGDNFSEIYFVLMAVFSIVNIINKFLPLKLLIRLLQRNAIFTQFRSYQRSYSAYRRKQLDVEFLELCRTHSVVPKFIRTFKLPNELSDAEKMKIFKKTLTKKITSEKSKLEQNGSHLKACRMDLFNATGNVPGNYLFHLCMKKIVQHTTKIISLKRTVHKKKFETLLQVSTKNTFSVKGTIINKSNYSLSKDESNLLKYGLKHGILTPLNKTRIKASFEEFYGNLCKKNLVDSNDANVKDTLRVTALRYINQNKRNSRKDEELLKNLQKQNIKTCKFDKGNGVVLLNNEDYNNKMFDILSTPMFQEVKLNKRSLPPNIKDEEHLKSLINSISVNENSSDLVKEIKGLFLDGCTPAKMYGLPKIHKEGTPMRPVISTIGSANHKVAKVLNKFLAPFNNDEFVCKDVFSFTEKINTLSAQENDFMASFDVKSLFTMIPLDETIDLCVKQFKEFYGGGDAILFEQLLRFSVKDVNFLFDDHWYQQIDGVSMGSPLAPTMANIFMINLEKKISNFTGIKPTLYTRYVDDIFLIFKDKSNLEPFFTFMNSLHPNIQFTYEVEKDHVLPFLDALVFVKDNRYFTSQYFKPTDTGLYLTPFSQCDKKYNSTLLNTLFDRTYKLSSTTDLAYSNMDIMKKRLLQNGYRETVIQKHIKKVTDKHTLPTQNVEKEEEEQQQQKCLLKIQYGKGIDQLKASIKSLFTSDQTNAVQIVAQTKTVGSCLSTKCRTPKECRTRVGEHNQRSRESTIKDHNLECNRRTDRLSINEFKIADKSFPTWLHRKYTEAIMINESRIQLINIKCTRKPQQLNLFN